MSASPKDNEAKIRRTLQALETLAPTKTFGGMTLAQFRAAVQPALDERTTIAELEDKLVQAKVRREQADDAALDAIQHTVNGVLADPTEGPDSALYAAFGYTRQSERKSGLTRKHNTPPKP